MTARRPCRQRGVKFYRNKKCKILKKEEAKSIRLLEWTLPTFFSGASEFYSAHRQKLHEKSRTSHKPNVSEWAKEFLQEKLKYEYDLYYLIRRIFFYKIGKLGFDEF